MPPAGQALYQLSHFPGHAGSECEARPHPEKSVHAAPCFQEWRIVSVAGSHCDGLDNSTADVATPSER